MHQTLILKIDIHERYKLQSFAGCILGFIYVSDYAVLKYMPYIVIIQYNEER